MKRIGLVGLALFFAATRSADAQLIMQMGNNWTFQFSGNVNGFLVYHDGKVDSNGGCTDGGCLTSTDKASRIRTGLLPGFANFDAKGKEGDFDLGVHFGFAPQINSDGGTNFTAHDAFGAQIDMRQVYLTVGGTWGQVLVGRELGLYQRQNILTDATLFGVGASGGVIGAGGTTLGRIGYGYTYPNFNAQMTYSSPAGRPAQFSVGLFDPSSVGTPGEAFVGTKIPRFEGEFTYKSKFGADEKSPGAFMFWVDGLWQHTSLFPGEVPGGADNPSIDSYGGAGGVKVDVSGFSIVGSGYAQKGVGTTLMFDGAATLAPPSTLTDVAQGRTTYGYIGQLSFTPMGTKWTVVGSYGDSRVSRVDQDPDNSEFTLIQSNKAIVGAVNYQWTKSLKWVGEGTWAKSTQFDGGANTAFSIQTGLMLFF